MGEPFLGEIRLFPYNLVPPGWARCDGSLLQVAQNQALYALLGSTYGGDGKNTFALPDLRGRTPVATGNGVGLGATGGEAVHALTDNEIPAHSHAVLAGGGGNQVSPSGNLWGEYQSGLLYGTNPNTTMGATAIGQSGGGQAHSNMQPYMALNYCIATQGIFPTPS